MSTFTGTAGPDTFTGGIDADTASGGAGADKLTGADGDDVITGGAGADTIDGGAGDDVLTSGDASPPFKLPYPQNPYVLPVLDRGTEVDNLQGGDGSDYFFAGYGDNVDGGANGTYGDYLYISFQGAPSGVTADFALASQTIGGGVITGIENISYVQGSQFADNLNVRSSTNNGYSAFTAVSGMDGNDTLTGGYYTGSLYGDAGDDVVDGRPSQYLFFVDGGDGNDTLYTNTNTFAQASGGAGNDTISSHGLTHGGAGNDQITLLQSYYGGLVYGDEGDDQIVAAESGNSIAGGAGADTLAGAASADSLFSADYVTGGSAAADDTGLEHDRLLGGGGDDALAIGYGDDADGGVGTDTLRLSLAGATQGLDFNTAGLVGAGPYTLGGGVIQNVETLLALRGTNFADTLRLQTQATQLKVDAGAGSDTIIAQASSVSVQGGAGDDRFVSGSAADTFDGGAGSDTIDYAAVTSGGVSVNLKTGSGAGGDILVSVEAVVGTALNDTLTSSGIGSTLSAGAGSDRLDLSFKDVATLGSGADLAVVSTGSHSADAENSIITITDWTADDRLQFGDLTGAYIEGSAGDFGEAVIFAERQEAAGYNFVAVRVGADVFVFGEAVSQRLHFDGAVRLVGVDLDAVSATNVGLAGPLAPPLPPPTSLTPTAGPDSLSATAGVPVLQAGAGNDTITVAAGGEPFRTYLRGDEGDDSISGGDGFDDINGNMGSDTCVSTIGDDWVVGGKDNDSLAGGAGQNLVYGNLGADTCDGGDNADIVRGGQDNDVVRGGFGDDFVSGDKGDDTMTGGFGADIFHTFGESGLDRVTDFNRADGDRVQLDPGTVYTVAQVGADTVIDMTGGGKMILVGVAMTSLTGAWIFEA